MKMCRYLLIRVNIGWLMFSLSKYSKNKNSACDLIKKAMIKRRRLSVAAILNVSSDSQRIRVVK